MSTVQELLTEGFQEAGEPSDLCPFTTPGDDTTFSISATGTVRLLRKLNTALIRVANWKGPSGRTLRLRGLQGRAYFSDPGPVSGTVVSATSTTVVVPLLGTDTTDELKGWFVYIASGTGAGQYRLIKSVVAASNLTLSVDHAWDTNPTSSSTYKIYKSFFKMIGTTISYTYQNYHLAIDPVTDVSDIIRIRDLTSLVDLSRVMKVETFTPTIFSVGIPSAFMVYGNEVWMDCANSAARSYEILYRKSPTPLTTAAQVPDIPQQLHEAVKLWMVHNILRLNQDFDGAYAVKRELVDLMNSVVEQGEYDNELDYTGVVPYD